MSINSHDTKVRRASLAALLVGAAVGVGATAFALSSSSLAAANPPPLGLSSSAPVAPQTGFAPLVSKVKPAVVQIATTSRPEVSQDDQDGQMQQQQQIPDDLPAPFGGWALACFALPEWVGVTARSSNPDIITLEGDQERSGFNRTGGRPGTFTGGCDERTGNPHSGVQQRQTGNL